MTLLLLVMGALGSVMGSVGADARPLHGYVDGDRLVFTTAKGIRCRGELLKMGDHGGLGSVKCEDGRTGSFGWTYLGKDRVTGDGWLAGESLTLTFDRVENSPQL